MIRFASARGVSELILFVEPAMNTAKLTIIEPEMSKSTTGETSTWKDWMGIVASVGCAIHCAAMPFVIAYLPALGLSFLADEAFHKWMALVCFLIAIVAFIPGIRKHRNWIPVSIGAIGLVFITFAAFGLAGECCTSCSAATVPISEISDSIVSDTACAECDECEHCQSPVSADESGADSVVTATGNDLLTTLAPWITPFGGMLLVSAHLLNCRYGSLCGCCGPNPTSETTE